MIIPTRDVNNTMADVSPKAGLRNAILFIIVCIVLIILCVTNVVQNDAVKIVVYVLGAGVILFNTYAAWSNVGKLRQPAVTFKGIA